LLFWVEDFDGEAGGCSGTGYEDVETGSFFLFFLHGCGSARFVLANFVVEMKNGVVLIAGKKRDVRRKNIYAFGFESLHHRIHGYNVSC
jgi:hypothetical protein